MKLSYAHGTSSTPLLGETIGENLRHTAEHHGDRDALVVRHQNYRATYRQLWDATTQVARALLARGVQKGDRIGIWAPNRWEWVVVQYATARIGAVLVNINPSYQTSELEYVLQQAGISGLLLARGFRKSDYVAMLAEVLPRCPDLRWSLVIDDEWDDLGKAASGNADQELVQREASLQF